MGIAPIVYAAGPPVVQPKSAGAVLNSLLTPHQVWALKNAQYNFNNTHQIELIFKYRVNYFTQMNYCMFQMAIYKLF